jgi:predicted aspartyl protease
MARDVHARPVLIKFLVDTGSPWMAISPQDAIKMNIPVSRLPKAAKYKVIIFANNKFERRLLSNVDLYLKNEKGETIKINSKSTSVLNSTKILSEEDKHIPSVLGCDFLTINKFRLVFNPSNKEGFFEKDD